MMVEHIFRSENDSRSLTRGIEDMCALMPEDWYGTLHEEIVRCHDCKHYTYSSWHRCDLHSIAHEVEPDGFCKWGERKMAFDDKRLKIFKWLEHIAKDNVSYAKGCYRSFQEILTIYGRLYATNGIILAEISYPEFEHISDNDCFMYVTRYKDDNGYLLEYPELEEYRREMRPRIFTDMFPDKHFYDEGFVFDAKVMRDALKPFEVYKLSPYMCIDGDRCELAAHDKDVSMRVLFMGLRR